MAARPESQKFSTILETTHLRVASCAMQGWRNTMEDAHVTQLNIDGDLHKAFIGVFDGHQSDEAAAYCRSHMFDELTENLSMPDISQALEQTYHTIDDQICKAYPSSGTTANCVLIGPTDYVCANAGDSRAVLCRGGTAVPLSVDHKPDNPVELARIEKAGGTVSNGRVGLSLAVSRALGDVEYKADKTLSWKEQEVTACPDIRREPARPDDEFIVVACDGIWDVLSSQACCDLIKELKTSQPAADNDLSIICEQVLERCLAPTGMDPRGTDNMTLILLEFKPPFHKSE